MAEVKEPGEAAYEAWCRSMGRDPHWRLQCRLDQLGWATAESEADQRGAERERAAVVKVLHAAGMHVLAIGIEAGNHLAEQKETERS